MYIAFDLDGTISDPFEGITRSINYALEKVGQTASSGDALAQYIGHPLQVIFSELLEDKDSVDSAIEHYLERYNNTGYRENILYQGVTDLLVNLTGTGATLFVVTSKRQKVAVKVLENFGIEHYFMEIYGCGLNRNKSEFLLQIKHDHKTEQLYMVGDRYLDIEAAKQSGCNGVGILWGYGSARELRDAGAEHLIARPSQLFEMLRDKQ